MHPECNKNWKLLVNTGNYIYLWTLARTFLQLCLFRDEPSFQLLKEMFSMFMKTPPLVTKRPTNKEVLVYLKICFVLRLILVRATQQYMNLSLERTKNGVMCLPKMLLLVSSSIYVCTYVLLTSSPSRTFI